MKRGIRCYLLISFTTTALKSHGWYLHAIHFSKMQDVKFDAVDAKGVLVHLTVKKKYPLLFSLKQDILWNIQYLCKKERHEGLGSSVGWMVAI